MGRNGTGIVVASARAGPSTSIQRLKPAKDRLPVDGGRPWPRRSICRSRPSSGRSRRIKTDLSSKRDTATASNCAAPRLVNRLVLAQVFQAMHDQASRGRMEPGIPQTRGDQRKRFYPCNLRSAHPAFIRCPGQIRSCRASLETGGQSHFLEIGRAKARPSVPPVAAEAVSPSAVDCPSTRR